MGTPKPVKEEEFDYVVAGLWPNGTKNVYTYGKDILHGTLEEALVFREYVRKREAGSSSEPFEIYKITYELIEDVPDSKSNTHANNRSLIIDNWDSLPCDVEPPFE